MCIRDRNQEEMEEVEEVEVEETTGELSEEHPQEDQLENPNPPEPEIEAEAMANNQPEKPIQDSEKEQRAGDHETAKGGPSMQDLMNFIAELSRETNKKLDSDKEELNKKL